jgi:hypothetical protein
VSWTNRPPRNLAYTAHPISLRLGSLIDLLIENIFCDFSVPPPPKHVIIRT